MTVDEATLCFPRRGDEVLLIRKKRGLGAGLYNGPGGKVEPDETVRECVVRELREEVGLEASDPEKRAELRFRFGDEPLMHVHAFVDDDPAGTAHETAEAIPTWVAVDAVPYEEMWADDRHWLPPVLRGGAVAGRFEFDADGEELLRWALTATSRPDADGDPWDGYDFEAPVSE